MGIESLLSDNLQTQTRAKNHRVPDALFQPAARRPSLCTPSRPQNRDDLVGWRKERSRYDGLVRRQKKLAKAAETPQPPRRSERLEKKMLFVSEEWLQKEHPTLKRVEAGTPIARADERRVQRRITATSTTPGGSEHIEGEMVAYTLPRPDESASEENRRFDRARR